MRIKESCQSGLRDGLVLESSGLAIEIAALRQVYDILECKLISFFTFRASHWPTLGPNESERPISADGDPAMTEIAVTHSLSIETPSLAHLCTSLAT